MITTCRQLGFSDAEEAKSGAFFGQGEGTIYMDGVTCDGSESKVTECPSHWGGWGALAGAYYSQ